MQPNVISKKSLEATRLVTLRIFFAFLFLLSFSVLSARQSTSNNTIEVTGQVVDAATDQPLSFVTVKTSDGKQGTITDRTGTFLLRIDLKKLKADSVKSAPISILASAIGYSPDTLYVSNDTSALVFRLQVRFLRSAEVVVTAEDPALQIMRSVLKRKTTQVETLDSYTYLLYTKFVAITDTVTAQRSTGLGDSTVFSVLESVSRGYYERPDNYFNEILQRRQTANIPPQANFVSFGTNLNAYEDDVNILSEQILSPLSKNALSYYTFVLESSIEDSVVEISATCNAGNRKAFNGTLYVNQNTAALIEVRLKPNKAVALPFDASLSYQQTFTEAGGYIMPEALSLQSSLTANILFLFAPRLDIDIRTFCHEFNINVAIPYGTFDERRVEVSATAETLDSNFWALQQKLPLRLEEAAAYAEIEWRRENPDSIERSFFEVLEPVARVLGATRRRPFSGLDDIFRYNRVHGLYLGMGLVFQPDPIVEIRVKGAYGFTDQHVYGELGTTLFLDSLQRWDVSGDVYRKLTRRDNPNIVKSSLVTASTLLFGNDYGDYFYSEGWSSSVAYSFGQLRFVRPDFSVRPSSIRLSFRSERQTNAVARQVYSLFNTNSPRRQNPEIFEGSMQSLGMDVALNYSPFRLISRHGMVMRAEYANNDVIATDFSFGLVEWTGFARIDTWASWTLDIVSSVGWTDGNLPPQRFFSLESSVSNIVSGPVFRGMQVKEFYGDRYATVMLAHNFGEVIPGILRIPNIASFGVEFILFGGIGWTTFSDQTLKYTKTQLPTTAATKDVTYYETGLGFNRVLLFFRFDVNARISQATTPSFRFTISNATL